MSNVSEMLGKTLVEIIGMEPESEQIIFICSDGSKYEMYHDQECCEYVRVEDVTGNVDNLIGSPLLMSEDVSNTNEADEYEHSHSDKIFERFDVWDSWTWTWYKFATLKGYVTVRWLGESNGYYSEDVNFDEVGEITRELTSKELVEDSDCENKEIISNERNERTVTFDYAREEREWKIEDGMRADVPYSLEELEDTKALMDIDLYKKTY